MGGMILFNAIHVVAADGSIQGTYDKVHLVPFGEYLPRHIRPVIALSGSARVHPGAGRCSLAATRRRVLEGARGPSRRFAGLESAIEGDFPRGGVRPPECT